MHYRNNGNNIIDSNGRQMDDISQVTTFIDKQ